MEKVHVIENIFEMDMIKDALDKEGLEYSIKEYKDTAYDGLCFAKGLCKLVRERNDEELAKSIVKHIRSIPYVVFSKD